MKESKNIKVSVIIPAFNAGKFIQRSVNSLLKSDMEDLEIIVVDDGSQDNTFEIADNLRQLDARIRLFWQENSGVSAARNLGLRMARGKYIGFCDSDDWVDPDMHHYMSEVADREKTDLVICDHSRESASANEMVGYDFPSGSVYGNDYICYLNHALVADHLDYPMTCSVWSCLFRKEVIDRESVHFPEGITNGEDFIFGAQYSACANSMTYLKGWCPYHYFDREGSASKADGDRLIANCKKIIRIIPERFLPFQNIPNLKEQILLSQIRYLSLLINQLVVDDWRYCEIRKIIILMIKDINHTSESSIDKHYKLTNGQRLLLTSTLNSVPEVYILIVKLKKYWKGTLNGHYRKD